MKAAYELTIELKPEVLDIEGRSIADTLNRNHFLKEARCLKIRASKRLTLEFEISSEADLKGIEQELTELGQNFFSNPVSQHFSFKRLVR